MGMAYNPKQRANDFNVQYVVNATGDRWFIPYNDNASKTAQVDQCKVMSSQSPDSTEVGSELVAS